MFEIDKAVESSLARKQQMQVVTKDCTMFDTSWENLAARANYRPRELAALCNVSLRTLQRHFSQHYGLTVSKSLRTIRLWEAYRRISEGELVKAVAYDLGYKQLSHFSRAFKELHGICPSLICTRPRPGTAAIPFPAQSDSVVPFSRAV